MVTYEQRLRKIDSVQALEEQIEKARKYAKRCRASMKSHVGTLAEKLELKDREKAAEKVVRQLRLKSFDIEDALKLGLDPRTEKSCAIN